MNDVTSNNTITPTMTYSTTPTMTYSTDLQNCDTFKLTIYTWVSISVAVCGCFGNLPIFLTLVLKSLKIVANTLLIILAIWDLTLLIYFVTKMSVNRPSCSNLNFDNILAKSPIGGCLQLCCISQLLVIAAFRFIAMRYPYKKLVYCTNKRTFIAVVSYSTLIGLLYILTGHLFFFFFYY